MIFFYIAQADPPQIDWLTPVITTAGVILVAVVGGIATAYRRRQDRQDQIADRDAGKQLSEKDEYDEVRQARAEATKYYNLYVLFRDMFHTAQSALRHLVRKIRDVHPDMEMERDVVDALAMKSPEADSSK